MIEYLVDVLGADIAASNFTNQNVLHFAAQGDKPISIYYFASIKKMDMTLQDTKGRTPLHWAVYCDSNFVIEYILAHS